MGSWGSNSKRKRCLTSRSAAFLYRRSGPLGSNMSMLPKSPSAPRGHGEGGGGRVRSAKLKGDRAGALTVGVVGGDVAVALLIGLRHWDGTAAEAAKAKATALSRSPARHLSLCRVHRSAGPKPEPKTTPRPLAGVRACAPGANGSPARAAF